MCVHCLYVHVCGCVFISKYIYIMWVCTCMLQKKKFNFKTFLLENNLHQHFTLQLIFMPQFHSCFFECQNWIPERWSLHLSSCNGSSSAASSWELFLFNISLSFSGTVAKRWRWATQSTSPIASTTTTRTASGTPSPHTTIIPDSEPHDQSLDLSADLFPGEPAPSWSSYLYYCTILWW